MLAALCLALYASVNHTVAHVAGFLTRLWYPRNVPEALHKLLLRGITDRLQVSHEQLVCQMSVGPLQVNSPAVCR